MTLEVRTLGKSSVEVTAPGFGGGPLGGAGDRLTDADVQVIDRRSAHRCHPAVRLAALTLLILACSDTPNSEELLLIQNANLISVIDGSITPQATLTIADGRIQRITSGEATSQEPATASSLDATGLYVIPGLWDMHVHTGHREVFFPLYLANGITGIRDMGGNQETPTGNLSIAFDTIRSWREAVSRGELLGPQIYAGGYLVDGPDPIWPGSLAVGDEAEARDTVRKLHQRGVDFIKVYALMRREVYAALLDEAAKRGLTVAGHIPDFVPVIEASTAGQKSAEHFGTGLYHIACSTREEALLQRLAELDAAASSGDAFLRGYYEILATALDTFDESKAQRLYEALARNQTWQVPTFSIQDIQWWFRADKQDPRQKYIPSEIREHWHKHSVFTFDHTPEERVVVQRLAERDREMVLGMRQAGVEFLAGSDSANPLVYPGFSLHDELRLMVEHGLTPLEALQAATINPARFLDITDSHGTLEKGKVADLVVLEENPLEDIRNTTRIVAVVRGGQLLRRDVLRRMLEVVATLVAEGPP